HSSTRSAGAAEYAHGQAASLNNVVSTRPGTRGTLSTAATASPKQFRVTGEESRSSPVESVADDVFGLRAAAVVGTGVAVRVVSWPAVVVLHVACSVAGCGPVDGRRLELVEARVVGEGDTAVDCVSVELHTGRVVVRERC